MTPDREGSPDLGQAAPGDLLAIAQDQRAPAEVVERLLGRSDLPPEVVMALLRHPRTPGAGMARLAERATGAVLEVLLSNLERLTRWVVVLEALLENPEIPGTRRPTIRRYLEAARKREGEGEKKKSLLLTIKDLPVGQRLALAKKGNKDARMILIKDSNEMVALEVVSSSRITDAEILAIAQMRDVCDKVLRYVAGNRKYRQNRQVVLSLLHNPKTPVGVSLSLGINRLADRDLVDLARDRNVPGAVARAAQQVLERRQRPAGGGGGH